MEDLRDVGQKALDSINNLGASDVGDLVLGIGDIIEELQAPSDNPMDIRRILTPEECKLKLEHLRGLFREFAHGEEYELKEAKENILNEDMLDTLPKMGALSGMFFSIDNVKLIEDNKVIFDTIKKGIVSELDD